MTIAGRNDIENGGGLIAINPHQILSEKTDPTAAVQVVSIPVKDWHPPIVLWKCGNFGTRAGKRRYCCHYVEDEHGLKNALSRCLRCRKKDRRYKKKNWATQMVKDARSADKLRTKKPKDLRPFEEIDWDRFITKEYVEKMYKMCRGLCWWCGVKMNKEKRQSSTGLTIERLTNQPHYKNTCVVSCMKCNRTSWRMNELESFFTGPPSPTSDKLHSFQTYLKSWERYQQLLPELDFQHH